MRMRDCWQKKSEARIEWEEERNEKMRKKWETERKKRNESISYTQNLLSSICVHRDFLMFTFFVRSNNNQCLNEWNEEEKVFTDSGDQKTITFYYIRTFSSTYSGDVLFMISFSIFFIPLPWFVCGTNCVSPILIHTHTHSYLFLSFSLSLTSFIMCLFNITWTHKRVTCHLVIFLLRNDFLLSLSLCLGTRMREY